MSKKIHALILYLFSDKSMNGWRRTRKAMWHQPINATIAYLQRNVVAGVRVRPGGGRPGRPDGLRPEGGDWREGVVASSRARDDGDDASN